MPGILNNLQPAGSQKTMHQVVPFHRAERVMTAAEDKRGASIGAQGILLIRAVAQREGLV